MLIDFGLARQVNNLEHVVNNCVVTVAYRAPETGNCYYRLDKADVWSLGVVLFAICHNKYPFLSSEPRFARFSKQQKAGVKPYEAICSIPGSPPCVQDHALHCLFDRMLILDPMQRCTIFCAKSILSAFDTSDNVLRSNPREEARLTPRLYSEFNEVRDRPMKNEGEFCNKFKKVRDRPPDGIECVLKRKRS